MKYYSATSRYDENNTVDNALRHVLEIVEFEGGQLVSGYPKFVKEGTMIKDGMTCEIGQVVAVYTKSEAD